MATQTNPDGFTYDPVTGTPVDKPTADNTAARFRQIDEKATNAEKGSADALATLGAVRQETTEAKTAAQQSAASSSASAAASNAAADTVERFGDDVELLKQMAEITPGSVTDAQTALLIQDQQSETHARLNAQSVQASALLGIGVMNRFPRLGTEVDDTGRIQRALNHCASKGIAFTTYGDEHSTGTYTVVSLTVPTSLRRLDFAGMTLKKPNLGAAPYNMTVADRKWVRMLTVSHNAATDMKPMTIANVELDGNDLENWSDPLNPSYEQEQASLIFILAASANTGNAYVNLENVTTRNCTSDGVHVTTNARVNIQNLRSSNCFRGGLTLTGGNTVINATQLYLESTREGMWDGVDLEVDSPGRGDDYKATLIIDGVIADKDIDISAGRGSVVKVSNLIMQGTGYHLGVNRDGRLHMSNAVLRRSNSTQERVLVRNGGQARFTNVEFHGIPGTAGCLNLEWLNITGETTDAEVTFEDCDFKEGTYGVATGSGQGYYHARFKGCRFSSTVTGDAFVRQASNIAVRFKSLTLDGCEFANSGSWLLAEGQAAEVVRVSNISITNPTSKGATLQSPTVAWLGSPTFENGWQINVLTAGAPTYKGARVNLTPAWAANTAYALGARVTPSGNVVLEATTAGTSGATIPATPSTVGGTVTDGTVVWTRR